MDQFHIFICHFPIENFTRKNYRNAVFFSSNIHLRTCIIDWFVTIATSRAFRKKTTKSFTVSIYLTEYINCNTRWCHFQSVFFVFVSMQDFGILKKAFLNKLLVSHSKEAFENEFQMLLFSNVEAKQVKYSSTMISLSIN